MRVGSHLKIAVSDGPIYVNFAYVEYRSGNMMGVLVDLRSKRAELWDHGIGDKGCPYISFIKSVDTLRCGEEDIPTTVTFCELWGWSVYLTESGKSSAKLVLVRDFGFWRWFYVEFICFWQRKPSHWP